MSSVPTEECVRLTLLETLSSSCANMFSCHRASSYRLQCAQRVLAAGVHSKKKKKKNSKLTLCLLCIIDSLRNPQPFEIPARKSAEENKKVNVNYRDEVKVKRRS